jgi:hypothetical protein
MHDLPEHVRRIIDRHGELEFTPPSFERWLGRLQMTRTLASIGAFMLVFAVTYLPGAGWDVAAVHGIVAALVFHFFAWAACLFIFGELYEVEVKRARAALEERERDRAQRIEEYYRDRLRAQGMLPSEPVDAVPGGSVPSLGGYAAPGTYSPEAPTQIQPAVDYVQSNMQSAQRAA